ncbi:MAG: alternative ribosome rescue aminoacyl-tRNA hydrolase ArfB [Tepidisphaeraceae bacterium]|jgi:ribosome-associated protein
MNPDPAPHLGGIELAPGVHAAPKSIRVQFARGGGPGGQNVNKLNTKAELWIELNQIHGMTPAALRRLRKSAGQRLTDLDEIHLSSDAARTQHANRKLIFERLRELIVAAQVQPKRRRPTRPTAGSRRRRLESKRKHSELKARRGESI